MISVVYCTRKENPNHTEHIARTSGLGKHIEVIEIINNGESLTKCYNRGLKESKNKIVVFMHDDIIIETTGWGKKILRHFEENPEFGIIGVAGTTEMPLSGQWWEDRTKMVGIVNHQHEGKKWESKYSKNWANDILEVVTVDGLFFCVHKDRIKNNFDENVEGFHFYEIDFNFSNYLKGVKIGVIFNIRLTHKSIGQTNEQWDQNRKNFIKKFNDDLPEKLVPDFYQGVKNNYKVKTKFNVIIQSTNDMESFHRLYEKIMSFGIENIRIQLISNDENYNELSSLDLPNLKIIEGFFSTLPKNLSILKYEDDLVSSDELILLTNDTLEILNNIFYYAEKLYLSNKNTFGCVFPLSYSGKKTVFCNSLEIFSNNDGKVAINLKDANTYYNVYYGHFENPFGNLSDCLITTATNLKQNDWFKLNYETPIYFNEFALNLYLNKKSVYIETNCLTVQSSFSGELNIQQDFQNLINEISKSEKLKSFVKVLQ